MPEEGGTVRRPVPWDADLPRGPAAVRVAGSAARTKPHAPQQPVLQHQLVERGRRDVQEDECREHRCDPTVGGTLRQAGEFLGHSLGRAAEDDGKETPAKGGGPDPRAPCRPRARRSPSASQMPIRSSRALPVVARGGVRVRNRVTRRTTSSAPITMPALICPVSARILSGSSLAMLSRIRPPAANAIRIISAISQCQRHENGVIPLHGRLLPSVASPTIVR